MRVLGALEDLELRDLLPAERTARQHVFHRMEHDHVGMLRQLLGEGDLALAAGISGEALVDLLLRLLAAELDLVRVQDDDEITGVQERGVDGLVLPHQDHGDLGREASEDEPLRVDDEPFLLERLRARDE